MGNTEGTGTVRHGVIIWCSPRGHMIVAENDSVKTRYYMPQTGVKSGPIAPLAGMAVTFLSLTSTSGKLPLAYDAVITDTAVV